MQPGSIEQRLASAEARISALERLIVRLLSDTADATEPTTDSATGGKNAEAPAIGEGGMTVPKGMCKVDTSRTRSATFDYRRALWELLPPSHRTPAIGEAWKAFTKMRTDKRYGTWTEDTTKAHAAEMAGLAPDLVADALAYSARMQYRAIAYGSCRKPGGGSSKETVTDRAERLQREAEGG